MYIQQKEAKSDVHPPSVAPEVIVEHQQQEMF